MDLIKFIVDHDVDKSASPVDRQTIESAEKATGVRFGEKLAEYLLKYGYLGYKHVELYGINSCQGMESDLVKQTLYLHKYFPETADFIAIENQGDGCYCVVDNKDFVYEYDSATKHLKKTALTLFEYILQRFAMADK